MNASAFKKLSNKHLAPKIRELGWKGSGFHFYQQNTNHVVNILGLQGSWYGGSVCSETAIHFDFIPDLGHKEIDISKTTYASCIIRERLSPKGVGDYHWTFRDNEEENIKSINQIWDAFKTHGLRFYNDFSKFPYPFDTIKPKDVEANNSYKLLDKYFITNSIYFSWLLKEISRFIGRAEIANEFSELGLRKTLDNASRMSGYSKSKKAKDGIQKYIDETKNMFRI